MTTSTNDSRRTPSGAGSAPPLPRRLEPAIVLIVAVAVAFVAAYGFTVIARRGWSILVPPTVGPTADEVASAPSLASMEARVRTEHDLRQREQAGIPLTLALAKGAGGERLILPPNSAGITEVIVELDPSGRTVWLAYGGEVTGKGTRGLPRGAVEQLVRDRPTVLRFAFSPLLTSADRQGGEVESVFGSVQLSDTEASAAELFTTAWPDGWATHFRNDWIGRLNHGSGALPAPAEGGNR